MDRQRRSASKVTDYRKFHLSGDLDTVVQGKVNEVISALGAVRISTMNHPEELDSATPEELERMIAEQKENSTRLQQQTQAMRLRNELEAEKLQQQQWEVAMQELKKAREHQAQQHQANINRMREISSEHSTAAEAQAVAWLQERMTDLKREHNPTATQDREEQARKAALEDLYRQQEELQQRIQELTNGETTNPRTYHNPSLNKRGEQETLMEQIRAALTPREPGKDGNRALLKALLTAQNKTTGPGGTTTLKPETIHKLTNGDEFSMAEWLASLNQQEEGESDVNRILNKIDEDSDCRQECAHSKMKSGMLDKSTTNIRHKEVWPQKNLGEDWAEEEMEFKQLKFEHLVAGETRTIETCTDPAQILGWLRLLRRIAYLKLRGIEWPLLRKMYAAILSSIETREYSWESNFDRFESILYRRVLVDRNSDRDRDHKEHRQEGRKRFCRDYNKPEGCPKNSPHSVWFGNGPNATKKMVHHCCAACIIRDKVARDHPEGHSDCPHRA